MEIKSRLADSRSLVKPNHKEKTFAEGAETTAEETSPVSIYASLSKNFFYPLILSPPHYTSLADELGAHAFEGLVFFKNSPSKSTTLLLPPYLTPA
jgi:hypothetical protein